MLARLAAERDQRDTNHEPIASVQAYLRENLSSPLTVPELAGMAGFSPSHFSARFRAATGFSVLEYLKRLRMARARQILIVTENSIAEIAAAVGYPDSFYFSRQFSAVNHTSPSEFRARSREESADTSDRAHEATEWPDGRRVSEPATSAPPPSSHPDGRERPRPHRLRPFARLRLRRPAGRDRRRDALGRGAARSARCGMVRLRYWVRLASRKGLWAAA